MEVGPTGTWIYHFRAGVSRVTPNSIVVLVYLMIEEEIVRDSSMFDRDVLRVSLPLEGTYDLEIRTFVQSSTVALEYKPCAITQGMTRQTGYTQ